MTYNVFYSEREHGYIAQCVECPAITLTRPTADMASLEMEKLLARIEKGKNKDAK